MITRKEFYFIRHGQTDCNVSGLKLDHEDTSLNKVGMQQALDVEPLIAQLPVHLICCSPLKRAKETKEIIARRLKTDHYEMEALGECTFQIWNDMTLFGKGAHVEGKEHVKEFIQRVLKGLNEALALEGTPLIVAHGGIHWAICCIMGIDQHDWFIDNCHPVHFFPDQSGIWKGKLLS